MQTRKLLLLACCTWFVSVGAVGCNDDDGNEGSMPMEPGEESPAESKDIVDVAVEAGFSTLAQALTDAELVATLKGEGPFTVFAPTDAAFAELPAGTLESLSMEQLTQILLYHVVDGEVRSTDLANGEVETLAGSKITVDLSSGVMINDAMVTMADVEAKNGVIHVVDKVLLPPQEEPGEEQPGEEQPGEEQPGEEQPADIVATAVAAGNFTVLAQALTDAGLVETLQGEGPFTVFAPTDEAFAALPEGTLESLTPEQLSTILLYHVLPGDIGSSALVAGPVTTASGLSAFVGLEGGATINGASVTTADIEATNGVIHVIDSVLLPPDIVDAAVLAGFDTLVQAVTDAGLVDTLKGDGPFTVFAPTDEAFAALPAGTLEGLSKAELTDILTYHVVSGMVESSDLSAGAVPTLLQGESVDIALDGGVTVNQASVVVADVVTTNGVIHVIDAVLLPTS